MVASSLDVPCNKVSWSLIWINEFEKPVPVGVAHLEIACWGLLVCHSNHFALPIRGTGERSSISAGYQNYPHKFWPYKLNIEGGFVKSVSNLLKEVKEQRPPKISFEEIGNDRVTEPDTKHILYKFSYKNHLKATVANSLRMEGSTF